MPLNLTLRTHRHRNVVWTSPATPRGFSSLCFSKLLESWRFEWIQFAWEACLSLWIECDWVELELLALTSGAIKVFNFNLFCCGTYFCLSFIQFYYHYCSFVGGKRDKHSVHCLQQFASSFRCSSLDLDSPALSTLYDSRFCASRVLFIVIMQTYYRLKLEICF